MPGKDVEKTIQVKYLARVEGEGALYVKVRNNEVAEVQLNIFEPPRFFEAFLKGRLCLETPDITARICGICPVAYQMSSATAIEDALGLKIPHEIEELRRLLYCGEWIESHSLHVLMLHAPDFLGYEDGITMAKEHGPLVEAGLALKKFGNQIVETLGGREIHPINVRVGGFYKSPEVKTLKDLLPQLKIAYETTEALLRFVTGFDFPQLTQNYTFVSLKEDEKYPFNHGKIVSSNGLEISKEKFEDFFIEEHVAHSNALHCRLHYDNQKTIYHVGPMARYHLNYESLPDQVKSLAKELGLEPPITNPFKSIAIRALELRYAIIEAKRIIDNYQMPQTPFVKVPMKSAKGFGATEAPRGLLYHRYEINDQGKISSAKIVPPTSQNQLIIENDVANLVRNNLHMKHENLTHRCEQAIRNYDPCISCATHFLNLTIDRD